MKYRINLFPKKERNITDQAVYFSFHYLRYILVVTQLVVIIVFFYRFKVDQEIVDLKDTLKQKKEIITVSQPILQQAHAVDIKSGFATGLMKSQNKYQAMITYFLSVFPSKLSLSQLIIENDSVTFGGTAIDVSIVQVFLARLRTDGKFKNVNLLSLKKSDFGYAFNFVLNGYTQ